MTSPIPALYSLLSELEKPHVYLRRIRNVVPNHYTVGSGKRVTVEAEHAIKMGYVRVAGADMWRLSLEGIAFLNAWREETK